MSFPWKIVRLINGSYSYRCRTVGYCHSKLHQGYLTKNLVKQHGCKKKHCERLQRFPESEFWRKKKR